MLLPGKVNDTTDSMTAKQAANLRLYIQAIAAERRNHEFDLAVVELDRCPLRAIGGRIYKDRVPSLRTRGPLLFVLSTADIHLPSSQMEFHRYVLPDERLIFQGHSPDLLQHFKYKKDRCSAGSRQVFQHFAGRLNVGPTPACCCSSWEVGARCSAASLVSTRAQQSLFCRSS